MVSKGSNSSFESYSGNRKEWKKPKNLRYCTYCRENGHEKDQCFKLHGVSDWYKGNKTKPFKPSANLVNIGSDMYFDTPLDDGNNSVIHAHNATNKGMPDQVS